MAEKEASVYFIFEKAYNKDNPIPFTASHGERAPLPHHCLAHSGLQDLMGAGWGGWW